MQLNSEQKKLEISTSMKIIETHGRDNVCQQAAKPILRSKTKVSPNTDGVLVRQKPIDSTEQ